jgi:hypothetical protein
MRVLFSAALIGLFPFLLFLSGRITIRRRIEDEHKHAEPQPHVRQLQGVPIPASIVGDNRNPTSAFPLKACQGDWYVLTQDPGCRFTMLL